MPPLPPMEILGYALAIVIGISLGLVGGGGSILTVPVLVYLLSISPVMATAYSLFVVGSSSLVGMIRYAAKGLVDFETAAVFGVPSIGAVYLTRKFLVPAIPETVFTLGSHDISKDTLLMVLFAALMIAASYSMIKPRKMSGSGKEESSWSTNKILIVLVEGLVVGALTGLVGAGGGFLIIPALVVLTGMHMKKAVGTSLVIIAVKSLIGFTGDASNYEMDWTFLIIFTLLSIVGIFIGGLLSTKIDGSKLRKGFGWFVLVMGTLVMLKEVLL